ncbi:glycoside hydrolase [Dyella halodurans]|uniref:Trehalase family glycosidase n=1 Tax=Dyella halodurans TaxID=1920171 RepID=A0ABV9BYV4_9GAMM|nr:trehalase family glycosidase [Dyella halodurans]
MHPAVRSVILALSLGALAGGSGRACADATADSHDTDARYFDLLDLHGTPRTASDRSFNIFFDAGSWHGYSLPPVDDPATGFTGPFVHSLRAGQWVGLRMAELQLQDAATHRDIALVPLESHAAPGYLVRSFQAPALAVKQALFFADSWHALVRIELTSSTAQDVDLGIAGQVMPSLAAGLAQEGDSVVQTFPRSRSRLTTRLHVDDAAAYRVTLAGANYRIDSTQAMHLQPNQTVVVFVDQTLVYDAQAETPPPVDDAKAWLQDRARWADYLKSIAASERPDLADDVTRRVAVKAAMTLLGNWRAARGDLHHDGVIPSYANPDFNGFWAWDSWKHAAALAQFAPELARNQMRAMFDYQATDGMVPDCVFLDQAGNNWRDSKPPLAAWATLEIFRATGDTAFLAEMYDKLVRYHRWWFQARDHDHNGLAEYGSTDGTRKAAAWESGMDNAVRFDGIHMLQNGRNAWSIDQESVDLNAYLYAEKRDLAQIAEKLGRGQEQKQWLEEAAAMRRAIQTRMFDPADGYFFDAKLGRDERVRVYGSEGWAPLWAGVADADQAAAVVRVMLDPGKFATFLPFPTLAKDDSKFSPIKGYWRGPVWLDQAYFGVEALRRYGYEQQANEMTHRLVLHARGLTEQAPFYENYDPLTGQGYQSRHFSWAAASYLLLLRRSASGEHGDRQIE